MLGLQKVLEAVLAKVEQGRIITELLPSRLREQDLAAVCGSHYARCSVHIQTDICPIDQAWLAGVQAHADADFVPAGPRMFCERSLCLCCCGGGILCGTKDDEECVAFGVDLVAVMRIERSAQHDAPRATLRKALPNAGGASSSPRCR